jgi:hypothetical protein
MNTLLTSWSGCPAGRYHGRYRAGCAVLFFSQAGFKLLLWRRVLRVDK